MLGGNERREVYAQGILGLHHEYQGAEPENILDDAMLIFGDIFECPQINTLMIVDGEECFFDAVHFFVGDDNDVEEVLVERREESALGKEKARAENSEHCMAHVDRCVFIEGDFCNIGTHYNQGRPSNQSAKRPPQAYPVLAEVELKFFPLILAGEIDLPAGVGRDYHR